MASALQHRTGRSIRTGRPPGSGQLHLDGQALSRTRFAISPLAELLAAAAEQVQPPQRPASPDQVIDLLAAVREAFARWLADDWPGIRRTLEHEVVRRAHDLVRSGAAQLFEHLHEDVDLSGGRLRVHPGASLRGAAEPTGSAPSVHGLLVVPSVVARRPILLSANELPVLRYPIRAQDRPDQQGAGEEPLPAASLLGKARAKALEAIGVGCSTRELADRLGVGAATASSHAAALRRGGLVATCRRGKQVEHLLTDLGARLLDARRP